LLLLINELHRLLIVGKPMNERLFSHEKMTYFRCST
jgi:hypothetical protein